MKIYFLQWKKQKELTIYYFEKKTHLKEFSTQFSFLESVNSLAKEGIFCRKELLKTTNQV